jgi:hypothetical protein
MVSLFTPNPNSVCAKIEAGTLKQRRTCFPLLDSKQQQQQFDSCTRFVAGSSKENRLPRTSLLRVCQSTS